jgi:hypothetical protein
MRCRLESFISFSQQIENPKLICVYDADATAYTREFSISAPIKNHRNDAKCLQSCDGSAEFEIIYVWHLKLHGFIALRRFQLFVSHVTEQRGLKMFAHKIAKLNSLIHSSIYICENWEQIIKSLSISIFSDNCIYKIACVTFRCL